jgi:hypothetical protein
MATSYTTNYLTYEEYPVVKKMFYDVNTLDHTGGYGALSNLILNDTAEP